MLFIRYSFDTRATISFQFIQKTPECYSNAFTLSVCVCDATCNSSSSRAMLREERFGTLTETHLPLSLTFRFSLLRVVLVAPLSPRQSFPVTMRSPASYSSRKSTRRMRTARNMSAESVTLSARRIWLYKTH